MTQGDRRDDSVRVLVVDDHDLFRAGLSALLGSQPGIEVVAQASGGRMAVRLAAELSPDVVLMDIRMPDLEGPETAREILSRGTSTRILALTVVTDEANVAAMIEAGALGFVTKDASMDEIASAVRAAAQGTAWLSPRAAEIVLRRVRRVEVEPDSNAGPMHVLSAREIEVLRLIARGFENTEIAETLGISPRTAKNHVSHILAKLGLPSRVQAAVYAVRRGLA